VHHSFRTIFAAILALTLAAPLTLAQEEAEPAAAVGPPSMRDMSPEERQAAYAALSDEDKQIVQRRMRESRKQQRAEWESMSPAERKAKRKEAQARMAELTPEQRAEMQERRERNQNAARNRGNQPRPEQQDDTAAEIDPE
jgi:hypothetical protein